MVDSASMVSSSRRSPLRTSPKEGKGTVRLMRAFGVVARAKTTKKVQHKGVIGNEPAEIAKGVDHPLHPSALLADAEIALGEKAEHDVRVEILCLPVADELSLEGARHEARR